MKPLDADGTHCRHLAEEAIGREPLYEGMRKWAGAVLITGERPWDDPGRNPDGWTALRWNAERMGARWRFGRDARTLTLGAATFGTGKDDPRRKRFMDAAGAWGFKSWRALQAAGLMDGLDRNPSTTYQDPAGIEGGDAWTILGRIYRTAMDHGDAAGFDSWLTGCISDPMAQGDLEPKRRHMEATAMVDACMDYLNPEGMEQLFTYASMLLKEPRYTNGYAAQLDTLDREQSQRDALEDPGATQELEEKAVLDALRARNAAYVTDTLIERMGWDR